MKIGKCLNRYQQKILERARALGATESDKYLLETLGIVVCRNMCLGFARFCNRFCYLKWIARYIWKKQHACENCGKLCGFNSCICRLPGSKYPQFLCNTCYDELSGFNARIAAKKYSCAARHRELSRCFDYNVNAIDKVIQPNITYRAYTEEERLLL